MHANPKTKGRILCAEDDADSLLLVDNRMPGLSGADLTCQVREFNTSSLFTPERI
jgi:FixJ family two-component response regulator